ncbi:hypothetical protein Vadar_003025 [Vaccinium darrowii]|nr:hypothetical protein Vadar_003025 [Vaccinium darrowii]
MEVYPIKENYDLQIHKIATYLNRIMIAPFSHLAVASDHLGKCKNEGTSKKTTPSAQRVTAGGILRLLVGTMEIHFFRREISTQKAEQLDFEKRTDEAISTYSRNLQLIKLVHGFGSVFLLIILPYAGAWVPLVMVLSFFFVFYCYIAYKEINDKIERMSELEKKPLSRLMDIQNEVANLGETVEAPFSGDECASYAETGVLDGLMEYKDSMKRDVYALQKEITRIVESSKNSRVSQIMSLAQRELQNDIACFGAEIKRTYSDEEFKSFGSIRALGEVWNWIGSLNRDAGALQSTITGLLEISSNSESSRSKSLFQVAACAIIHGFSFPMMAYYLLSWFSETSFAIKSSMLNT